MHATEPHCSYHTQASRSLYITNTFQTSRKKGNRCKPRPFVPSLLLVTLLANNLLQPGWTYNTQHHSLEIPAETPQNRSQLSRRQVIFSTKQREYSRNLITLAEETGLKVLTTLSNRISLPRHVNGNQPGLIQPGHPHSYQNATSPKPSRPRRLRYGYPNPRPCRVSIPVAFSQARVHVHGVEESPSDASVLDGRDGARQRIQEATRGGGEIR